LFLCLQKTTTECSFCSSRFFFLASSLLEMGQKGADRMW
jgi:hypothetical protein